jgi:putative transposase
MASIVDSKNHFHIAPGNIVSYQGSLVTIRKLIGLDSVIVEHNLTRKTMTVTRQEILPSSPVQETKLTGSLSSSYSQQEWDDANAKFEIIKKAVENPGDGTVVEDIAEKSGRSKATIYRWLEKYERSKSILSLVEGRGSKTSGRKKLDNDVEEIIKEGIKLIYFAKGVRKDVNKVIEFVVSTCKKLKLKSPHPNSIRNRIKELDEYAVAQNRESMKTAREKFDENRGAFPEPESALGVVQIDHTPVDCVLVDPVYRLPVGKPWVTTAIDVKTRMLTGYYLSFNAPSRLSVGLCVACSVLPKEKLLLDLGVKGTWPVWGFMQVLHSDNGSEFRSEDFNRACAYYHINNEYRPKGRPHFGGHIESFQKTLSKAIHNLPGSSFSNVKERGEYESEKHAALTFDEFEKWLVTFIVNVYHQKKHSSMGSSPIRAWEDEIVGDGTRNGIGYQPMPDEDRVKIDFLPTFYRTVQEYGVANDTIYYYSDVLKKWIHRKDKTTGKAELPKKHEFRYDPRDLSMVHFYDPELDEYFKVPYRNLKHPKINIWELRAIKKHLKECGEKYIDEDKIFSALDEMIQIEENAKAEKKKARREKNRARKQNSEKKDLTKARQRPATINEPSIWDKIDVNKLKGFD